MQIKPAIVVAKQLGKPYLQLLVWKVFRRFWVIWLEPIQIRENFGVWVFQTGRDDSVYSRERYVSAFLVSIALRRPLVGEIVSRLDGEGKGWRDDPARVRAFTRASWLWAWLFLTRLAVQLPLQLRLTGTQLVLTVPADAASSPAVAAVARRVGMQLTVPALPYGLRVRSLQVQDDGLHLGASADRLRLLG